MSDGEDVRCTDEKLFQLCKDFDKHVDMFERHVAKESEKFDKLIEAQQVNTQAISTLTKAITDVVSETRDIVQLHKDFQGAARVGKGLQGFMVWCLKWGAIGAGCVAIINAVLTYFSDNPVT